MSPCCPVQHLELPPQGCSWLLWGRGAGAAGDGGRSGVGASGSVCLWMPCSAQGLAFTGDAAQSLCLCLHEEGTGTGTFHGGVARTPQGRWGWLGALPVPTGRRCRGRPCHLTFPLCKLGGHKWGHWPRSLGAWCSTWWGGAAAPGRGCLSPPVLPPGVGLSTPTRRMHPPVLDPTGTHPRGTVPPLPSIPGRAVWPGWGERREPQAEAWARVLLCRQKRQSQSKSRLFIASAVGKPRCRGAVDGATRRWGGCPGGCTQDGAGEEERCPGIPSGRQDGERGDGDIPISLSCAPGEPSPASATPSIQGRCCRGC